MTEQQRRAIVVAEVTVSINALARHLNELQAGAMVGLIGIKDRAEFAQVACDLMTESSRLMAAVVAE